MRIITVDLGASSGRVIVAKVVEGKLVLEEMNRFYHSIIDHDGTLSWDIDFIYRNVKEGIDKALDLYQGISSIGIDTWGVDYVYLDKDDKLVRDPLSYRDPRVDKASEDVLSLISKEKLYARFGIQFLKFNTIFQLYDDFNHRKKEVRKAKTFLMLPDYLAYLLTGEKRLEITNASTTSLLDPKHLVLDEEVLKTLKIPATLFPPLINPGEKIGDYVYKNKKYPVRAVCSHDTASAILGTNIDKDAAYLSSGTWSLLGVELTSPLISEKCEKFNFTNELGYGQTFDFLKNIMGMFIVNNLRSDWKKEGRDVETKDISRLVKEAKDIPSYFDPDDERLSTPFDMEKKLISVLKATKQVIPSTQGEWLKLIYRSMACKYRFVLDRLSKTTNHEYRRIVICGGGNKAEALNQMSADITGCQVELGPDEATVVGNALAQLIAIKEVKNVAEGRKLIKASYPEKTYTPQNKEQSEKDYAAFLKILHLA